MKSPGGMIGPGDHAGEIPWPWLGAILVLASAVRVWMVFSIEPSIQDVVPMTESRYLFPYHDPFSVFWGHLTHLFVDNPPVWWARLPSMAASVATVAFVSRFSARFYGVTAGVLAGLILSVSFPMVVSSAFVRGYSIHVLGAWLMVTSMDRLMHEGRGARGLVVGTLLCAAHQWVVPFVAMWVPILAAWLILRMRTEQGLQVLRRLREPATLRAMVASGLILAALASSWLSVQIHMGVKAAYQQGSPHLYYFPMTMLEQMLILVSKPVFLVVGGSHWLAALVYPLAAWGLFVSARRLRGRVVALASAIFVYLLIPVLVEMNFGSVGFQVGHWQFMAIPLALWLSIGATSVIPSVLAARLGKRRVVMAAFAMALAVSVLPNLHSVARYTDRGYHLVLEHSWTDIERRLEEALVPEGNLVFMESERLFLTSHLLVDGFGRDDLDITLLSERLPGSPLFRRFLLHDLWKIPGGHLPLHRWKDFDGLRKEVTHWTGRVILVLPNPEYGPYADWFTSGGPHLPRQCGQWPSFAKGIEWSGSDNGWVTWFDVEREPIQGIEDRIQRIRDTHSKVCLDRFLP